MALANVEQIIGGRAEPYPTFHAALAFVSAAAETMATLDDADAPLASGAPFLAVAEPALLLLGPARGALAGAIGNAHPFDTLRLGSDFVFRGVEAGIRCYQPRCASQQGFMPFDGWDQKVRVTWGADRRPRSR